MCGMKKEEAVRITGSEHIYTGRHRCIERDTPLTAVHTKIIRMISSGFEIIVIHHEGYLPVTTTYVLSDTPAVPSYIHRIINHKVGKCLSNHCSIVGGGKH